MHGISKQNVKTNKLRAERAQKKGGHDVSLPFSFDLIVLPRIAPYSAYCIAFTMLCACGAYHVFLLPLSVTANGQGSLLRLLTDIGKDTAVDIEYLTVYKVRRIGRKEHSGTAEVLSITPSARGGL